jgi:hypothetical protein
MKPLKILFILCIMLSVGQESIQAQVPQLKNYQLTTGIKSNPTVKLDTTFRMVTTSGLNRQTGWEPYWINSRVKTSFDPMTINGNYNDLINNQILLNCERIKSAGKSAYMPIYGNSGTFNGKWERLTGKPIFDTTRVYYYPLKRTSAPALTDNNFYRLTGNIFNTIMDMKYPMRNSSK